jgi:hypothetical protein
MSTTEGEAMTDMTDMTDKTDWVQRLAKWRTIFAGWQLGTRVKGDPECDAVRDHREATLMLRAELSALTTLAIRKGLFTEEEFKEQLNGEAEFLCGSLEKRFPGIKATDIGLSINVEIAKVTMAGWET